MQTISAKCLPTTDDDGEPGTMVKGVGVKVGSHSFLMWHRKCSFNEAFKWQL